jgi:Protein of unknown function (DUF4230)
LIQFLIERRRLRPHSAYAKNAQCNQTGHDLPFHTWSVAQDLSPRFERRYTEAVAVPDASKWKLATFIATFAFLALLIFTFASLHWRSAFGARWLDSNAIVTQVKPLKQLVTVRYSIQHVVGLREPKVPLGEESILLMVQGEALAGVDLEGVTSRDIAYSRARTVSITLPRAKLFNVFLDEKETKIWDRQITWWTPWVAPDPDLEHQARLRAIDEVRNGALSMGILDQAQKNAETAIRDLLRSFDLETNFKTRTLD